MLSAFSFLRRLFFNYEEEDKHETEQVMGCMTHKEENREMSGTSVKNKERKLGMTGTSTMASKRKEKPQELIDLIFSWSISDVMNKDLYKDKVKRIPVEFSSVNHYLKSFIDPLIEETHADLFSKMTTLLHAPACEISGVIYKDNEKTEGFVYKLILGQGEYRPEIGDMIALTEVRPESINDLDRLRSPYVVALVEGMIDGGVEDEGIALIISSKPIMFENKDLKKGRAEEKLFAVHLTNLTTNLRIWRALQPDLDRGNLKIVETVLRSNPNVEEHCSICSSNVHHSINVSKSREAINPLRLDNSQKDAVLSTIEATECHHQNNVKLIWGPPGTGKTKTIAALLFSLFKLKRRTVTCAPTNVAVLGVTKRLMSLLGNTLMHEMYGLGDILLFGNGERMNIDDHEDIFDIFLDHRAFVLSRCFAPLTGWKGSLEAMIYLLEDPKDQYRRYLEKESEENEEDYDTEKEKSFGTLERKRWHELSFRDMKKNKKGKSKFKVHSKRFHEDGKLPWTFEDYFIKRCRKVGKQLKLCKIGLITHMPTSCLPLIVLENMIKVHETLQTLELLMNKFDATQVLSQVFEGTEITRSEQATEFCMIRLQCLAELKVLRSSFMIPNFVENHLIKSFCLKNASLIFCTASSSVKLHTGGMTPIELVIIDEAAQLKECESCIPLQLPGLRHAILVGDEKQLPAMVQSKICERADFGRSLFERLVILEHSKKLLNVQYRMHPSISFFPNKEFYGKKITNGQNVVGRSYEPRFLKGKMFESYSFIDVNYGKEDFDNKHSQKNMVEAFVVAEIVSRLCQENSHSKQKLSVGCISPYKAQVRAIQEKLGNNYSADVKAKFSVNVRSVDGFQGGEEDVIIISTVRCNRNGSVGFLSNAQRTNVALTRARYCLWIIGSAATLLSSGSVWKRLVLDAKNRGRFFNAYDEKSLALAISNALVELGQFTSLFCTDSILFKTSKWKVMFTAEFQESMIQFRKLGIAKDVSVLLVKLSNGWREELNDGTVSKKEVTYLRFLEIYDVKEPIKMVWSVDIVSEKWKETQVIKIWDVLPTTEIPKLVNTVDVLIGNQATNYMNRCLFKRIEGNSRLPMTWPLRRAKVRNA